MFSELDFERSLYIGNIFSSIFFGAQLVLCFQSIHFLLKQHRRHKYFYACYSLLIAILLSFALASNCIIGQFSWINHRDIPGGPAAYLGMNSNVWYTTLGTSAAVAVIFMSDSLMLYRSYIILGSHVLYVIFPALILLASTALGIVSVVASAQPQKFIFSGNPAVFGKAWVSLSVAYNGIITAMICGKLLHAQRSMKGLVSTESVEIYTGVIAILVESALPYAISGIVLAAVFDNQNIALAFSTSWTAFAAISPQLIILRVSMGVAWSKDTLTAGKVSEPMVFRARAFNDQSATRIDAELQQKSSGRSEHSSVVNID